MRALVLGLVLFAVGCAHVAAPLDVLVIAPHPDDEVLLAGGVLERAVKHGQRAAVIIVTNGDYTCSRNAAVREAESVAALTALGLAEDDVHFLGYPDGYLHQLSESPLPPVEHAAPDGTCTRASRTWARRGAHRRDEHTARTGAPAPWTSDALVGDLTALLERLRPRNVFLPHFIDTHADHSSVYAYFRRALDRLARAPAAHRGLIHAADECWPSDCRTYFTPDRPTPPLPSPLSDYKPAERLPVDALHKRALIERYASQLGPSPLDNWHLSFARADEAFFPEQFEVQQGHWVPVGSHTVRLTGPSQRLGRFEVLLDERSVQVRDATTHATVATWPRPAGTPVVNVAAQEVSLLGDGGFVGQVAVPAPSVNVARP